MRYGVTSHEAHWWKLIEDFVTNFNEYCTQLFYPLDLICADESISWWYIQGGHWVNLSFPIYASMDTKPGNGLEIHNSLCGQSSNMMQIRIANYAKNEEEQQDDRENIPHGTKVLKEFVMPWANTDRIF